MTTQTIPQFAVAYTAPGQNANNAPMLNVLGMPTGVKITAHLGAAIHAEGTSPFTPENIARFKALDARYNHEVFYEQMPEHMAKYGPKD